MKWPISQVVAMIYFAKFNFTCVRGSVAEFADNQNMYLAVGLLVGLLVNAKPETVAQSPFLRSCFKFGWFCWFFFFFLLDLSVSNIEQSSPQN